MFRPARKKSVITSGAGLPIAAAVVGMFAAPSYLQAAQGSGSMHTGDLGQAIFTVVIFLVLLAVLGKWAWKPILQQLQQREKGIQDAIERAEKRETEAATVLKDYQLQLESVQLEARELLDQARREAAENGEKVLQAAQEEARKSADSAREAIEQARQEALRELHDHTAQLAVDVAGQVLRKQLSPDDHQRLVRESLEEIRTQAEGEL